MKIKIDKYFNKISQKIITNKDFNNLLKEEVDNRIEYFKKGDESGYVPQLTVYMKAKEEDPFTVALIVIAGDGFDTYEGRCKSLFEIGKKIHKEFTKKQGLCPSLIFMSSEAWMKTLKQGEKQTKEYVHDYPDKKEAIITCGLTVDLRSNFAYQDIVRNKKNNISLKKAEIKNYDPKEKNPEAPMLVNFYKGWFIASQGTGILN